jgi:L-fuculose-phosphate aldolase
MPKYSVKETKMDYSKFMRQQICDAGNRLWQFGFTPSNAGNICVKVGDDEYLATPTRVSKGSMTPDMIVKINGNLEVLESNEPYKLTSEIKVHMRALQVREKFGATATVHIHSPYCQVFSLINEPFMDLEGEFIGIKSVPITPFEKPGSWELAESIVPAMEKGPCVIMGSHGTLTVGATLDQAVMLAEMVEHSAKVAFLLRQIKK